jgi:Type II CAAX prenyl endopeptidase Rce1-like
MTSPHKYPWRLFFLLLAAAVLSVVALLPYLEAMLGPKVALHPLPLPLPLLAGIQATFNFSIAVGIGLLAARALGLGAPVLEAWVYARRATERRPIIAVSTLTGVVLGALTLLIALSPAGEPLRDIAPVPESALPFWKRLLACPYGGIGEEILMRLFLLSGLLWIASKLFRSSARSRVLFWTVNVLVALAFGAGHLPFAASLHPLTPALVTIVIALNAFVALGFGYLYWSRGLEAAMLAHFTTDIVLHVIGPLLKS